MEAYWVLVGLLCLCGVSLSQECDLNILENTDFPGTDITHVYSPDVEHCQMMCTQHPNCLFFTFVRPDWTIDDRHFFCYLKYTATGQPKIQKPLLGVTSGYSLKPCSPKPATDYVCLFLQYENIDFLGADYRSLFTADYEQCQRSCTQDPGCEFFTFASGLFRNQDIRYKCHLKFSWTVPNLKMINAKDGVVSGFSHKLRQADQNMQTCQTKMFPNTEIPGHDLEMLLAASPDHCLSLCSNHPLCTYFTYFNDTDKRFHCYLKNNVNQMVTKANEAAVSGIPTRVCRPDSSWVKATYEGVDFQGSDMRYVLLDDPDTCQRTCTEDHNCQFYTYVNEAFFDPSYWRRCFLKRVITMPAPPKITKLHNVMSGFSQKNCQTAPCTNICPS